MACNNADFKLISSWDYDKKFRTNIKENVLRHNNLVQQVKESTIDTFDWFGSDGEINFYDDLEWMHTHGRFGYKYGKMFKWEYDSDNNTYDITESYSIGYTLDSPDTIRVKVSTTGAPLQENDTAIIRKNQSVTFPSSNGADAIAWIDVDGYPWTFYKLEWIYPSADQIDTLVYHRWALVRNSDLTIADTVDFHILRTRSSEYFWDIHIVNSINNVIPNNTAILDATSSGYIGDKNFTYNGIAYFLAYVPDADPYYSTINNCYGSFTPNISYDFKEGSMNYLIDNRTSEYTTYLDDTDTVDSYWALLFQEDGNGQSIYSSSDVDEAYMYNYLALEIDGNNNQGGTIFGKIQNNEAITASEADVIDFFRGITDEAKVAVLDALQNNPQVFDSFGYSEPVQGVSWNLNITINDTIASLEPCDQIYIAGAMISFDFIDNTDFWEWLEEGGAALIISLVLTIYTGGLYGLAIWGISMLTIQIITTEIENSDLTEEEKAAALGILKLAATVVMFILSGQFKPEDFIAIALKVTGDVVQLTVDISQAKQIDELNAYIDDTNSTYEWIEDNQLEGEMGIETAIESIMLYDSYDIYSTGKLSAYNSAQYSANEPYSHTEKIFNLALE